jgi:hypothetical protein
MTDIDLDHATVANERSTESANYLTVKPTGMKITASDAGTLQGRGYSLVDVDMDTQETTWVLRE